ncbi:hypothetical protein [Roseivirga sp.]|uniref:hypothetical protein n=1 Tax=Roseivirga sp. TaxID=1964215 RepID=UPI003B8CEAD4
MRETLALNSLRMLTSQLTLYPKHMRYFIVFWLILLSFHGNAQVIEKSYVTTDREVYAPGDTLWFKGYVFNRFNQLSDLSLALHVVISDENKKRVNRSSWSVMNALTHGNIVLPSKEGSYMLHAYSGQMAASDADQVFRKKIYIRSNQSDIINLKSLTRNAVHQDDSSLKVDYAIAYTGEAVKDFNLGYEIWDDNEIITSGETKSDEKGEGQVHLENLNATGKQLHLLLEAKRSGLKTSRLKIPIQSAQQTIDLQFFPEGGNLVAGVSNSIAYKAINSEGLPVDIEGDLMDNNGDKILSITSYYKGMGKFRLTPQPNTAYHFQIKGRSGDSKFNLPEVQPSGISISVDSLDTSSIISLLIQSSKDLEGKAGIFELTKNDRSAGQFEFSFQPQQLIRIPIDKLNTGIYAIRVYTRDKRHVAERLIFIKPNDQLSINIKTDKSVYKGREKVDGQLTAVDSNGSPVAGNFSISAVYKSRALKPQSEQPNLQAQILLNSELKGSIPTPNFYFSNQEKSLTALNLVMLTNGWRQYSPSTIEDPEAIVGRTLLKRDNSKPFLDTNIEMISELYQTMKSYPVDTTGRFKIVASQMKGLGDTLTLIGSQDKKLNRPNIALDSKYLFVNTDFQKDVINRGETLVKNDVYLSNVKVRREQFQGATLLNSVYVTDQRLPTDGCSVFSREPEGWVTKTATQLDRNDTSLLALLKQVSPLIDGIGNIPFAGITPKKFEGNDDFGRPVKVNLTGLEGAAIAKYAILTTEMAQGTFLYRQRLGQKPISETIISYNTRAPFEFCINCQCSRIPFNAAELTSDVWKLIIAGLRPGQPYYLDYDPNQIDFTNVESISIRESQERPIILVTTENAIINRKTFIQSYHHIGKFENKPDEYYRPIYNTKERVEDVVPDARDLIFWNPKLMTDKNGNAEFSFYNADRPQIIQILIEGVGNNGQLGTATTEYLVLNERVTLEN